MTTFALVLAIISLLLSAIAIGLSYTNRPPGGPPNEG